MIDFQLKSWKSEQKMVHKSDEIYVFSSRLKPEQLEQTLILLNSPLNQLTQSGHLVKILSVVNQTESLPGDFHLRTYSGTKLYGAEDALHVLKRHRCQIFRYMFESDSKSCLVISSSNETIVYLFSLDSRVQCSRITQQSDQCKRTVKLSKCRSFLTPDCNQH